MAYIIVFTWWSDGPCDVQPSVASMSTTYIVQTGDHLLPGYTCTITMHRTFMLSMIIKYRYSFMIVVMSRQLELNLQYVFLWTLFCLIFIYFQTLVELEDIGPWPGISPSWAPAPQASLDLHSSVVGVLLITTSCWQTGVIGWTVTAECPFPNCRKWKSALPIWQPIFLKTPIFPVKWQ